MEMYKTDYAFERKFNRTFKDEQGNFCLEFNEKTPNEKNGARQYLDATEDVMATSGHWLFVTQSICFNADGLFLE